jgi:hypothetical protein
MWRTKRGLVTAWLNADARLAMVERAMAAVKGERVES